jgi:hypothetical protein
MCAFVTMRPLMPTEEAVLVQTVAPLLPAAVLPPLLYFVGRVRGHSSSSNNSSSNSSSINSSNSDEEKGKGKGVKLRRDDRDDDAGAAGTAAAGAAIASADGLANDPALLSLRSALSTRALMRVCR